LAKNRKFFLPPVI